MSSSKSSQGTKRREAVIEASLVAAKPYTCPVCGHKHVVLEGKWQRIFQKEFLDNKEIGVIFQEEDHVERYVAIVCDNCNTRSQIEPDHVVKLLADNLQLQMLLAVKNGTTVIRCPEGKVN